MYKFIFELITDPLGLPIPILWEYIILLVLNEIALRIAWKTSPGGRFGSEIHWAVRIPTFIILWAITYVLVIVMKWIYIHRIVVLLTIGGFILIGGIIKIIIYRVINKNKRLNT